jgi:threonine/homoserine/homoserine lactone efflux protein
MNVFAQLEAAKQWIKQRFAERTTWDGSVIIGISVLALAAAPLIKWIAWAGIAYGIWTIWKSEQGQ